jgi:hypothetical protein
VEIDNLPDEKNVKELLAIFILPMEEMYLRLSSWGKKVYFDSYMDGLSRLV